MNDPLTFAELAVITEARGKRWGEVDKEFRAIELGGEAGEALNAVKKRIRYERGMPGGVESLEPIEDELGDVVISAQNLAVEFGIDLAAAIRKKFNKTSEQHGFPERL